MRLETPQIVRSAQVWVCDACGCQDRKSCGCDSSAHAEEMAVKREQARQRKIKQRERENANEINNRVTRDADVENSEETDDDQTVWRRGLAYRAKEAIGHAAFEDWSGFTVDSELIVAAELVAEAWNRTAAYLKRLQAKQRHDDGLDIPDHLRRTA